MTNFLERLFLEEPVQPIQMRQSALRAHAAALPIPRDSPDRARVEMRERYDASRLYEAALVLLTGSRGRLSTLKAWGMGIAKGGGMQKAVVAASSGRPTILRVMSRMTRPSIVRMLRRAGWPA